MTLATIVCIVGACTGLVVAALSLGFSSAPGWRDQRRVALVALGSALFCLGNVHATLALPAWLDAGLARLTLAASGWTLGAWFALAEVRLPGPLRRTGRLLAALGVGFGCLALVPGLLNSGEVRAFEVAWAGLPYRSAVPTLLGRCASGVYAALVVLLLARGAWAWRRGNPEAGSFCLSVLTVAAAGLCDILTYNGHAALPYLTPLGFLAVVGLMGVVTTRRFVAAARMLEELPGYLEDRVQQRTRELGAAHEALVRTEKLAALGQLAAGVAHEVNNPAAAVMANLNYLREGLERGVLPEDTGECLEESSQAMERIARIVRQLLDAGRAAAHRPDGTQVASLAGVVDTAVRLARHALPAHVRLSLDVPAALRIRGSPQPLEQVVLNLLVNAAHAMPPGRPHGLIQVRARAQGGRALLEVQDDGCGMDAATQRRLFEPFFTTKPMGQGTGLGLSVSIGIVRSLGGSLSVESAPGVGTTLRVELECVDGGSRGAPPPPHLAAA